MSTDARGLVPGVVGAPRSTERINTSVASARTATDLAPYSIVRLLASVDTHVRFTDSTGVALASDMTLTAGYPEIFSIGEAARVAAILDSSAGTLEVTWLA